MKKSMKKEINERYSEVFKNLYVDWKKRLKITNQELKIKGINTSGAGIRCIYDLIEKLSYDTTEKLDEMFTSIEKEYKTKIRLKELNKYLEKSKDAICNHVNTMEKDVLSEFEITMGKETNELRINNIKENVKLKIDRIYDKHKNLYEFRRIEWLVVINTIATIGGFIISIMSLAITLK